MANKVFQLNSEPQPDALNGKITPVQFNKITSYLSKKYGLHFKPEKKFMLESRFIRRLSSLKFTSFNNYIEHVFQSDKNQEYKYFVDLVTTHKTFFFREKYQFDFLKDKLPEYLENKSNNSRVSIWSAGCSTGEEVYTLGMTLNECKEANSGLDYKILGTDISIISLQKAAKGIYSSTEVQDIEDSKLKKYFRFNQENGNDQVVFAKQNIISKINLGILNLNNPDYKISGSFDFIFCRNVIIYFDLNTQKQVLAKLVDKLKPGGYLFLGHSETAIGTKLPIQMVQPTIYQKIR